MRKGDNGFIWQQRQAFSIRARLLTLTKAHRMNWLTKQRELLFYKVISGGNFPRRIEWPLLLEWLSPRPGDRILDVACGRGGLTLKISAEGCQTVGVDMSDESLEWARLRARRLGYDCSFVKGDAQQLPFQDASFNKIVSSSALEHFHDDRSALKEMTRVLKPEGRLVLTVDSFTYPIDDLWKARHKQAFCVQNYYDKRKLRTKLTEAGLHVQRTEYLMHSRVAHFFFKRTISYHQSLLLSGANVLVAYPAIVVAEHFSKNSDHGFSLIAEATKSPECPD
jgi:SAM-dependent methyltransferase